MAKEPLGSVLHYIRQMASAPANQELTDKEFFHYWEKVHGPIGVRIPHLRRLVQSHRSILQVFAAEIISGLPVIH